MPPFSKALQASDAFYEHGVSGNRHVGPLHAMRKAFSLSEDEAGFTAAHLITQAIYDLHVIAKKKA